MSTDTDTDTNTDMDAVFHALASEARRGMLGRLAGGELTVSQLAEPLSMSLAAASKHIQVLERAGLIRRTVTGRRHLCRLEPGPLRSAHSWLRFYEHFWSQRLDALEAMLGADPTPAHPSDDTDAEEEDPR